MLSKEKYGLFVKYHEETENVKKVLETKSSIILSLLGLLLSGFVFKLNQIVEILSTTKPSLLILTFLLSVILIAILLTLLFSLRVIKGKAYHLLIPDNYLKLFFISKFSDEDMFYNELLKKLKYCVELNSSLNLEKSRQIRYSQIFLITSYFLTFISLFLLLIYNG
jgi:hypothetical protein